MSTNLDVLESFEENSPSSSSLPFVKRESDLQWIPKTEKKLLKGGEWLIRAILLFGFVAVLAIEAYLILQIWSTW